MADQRFVNSEVYDDCHKTVCVRLQDLGDYVCWVNPSNLSLCTKTAGSVKVAIIRGTGVEHVAVFMGFEEKDLL